MEKDWSQLTEKILQLTLEMIFLLTGKVYVPESKPRDHVMPSRCVAGGRISAPPSLTAQNNKKILEVTKNITKLLTREVPIMCQDVAVYLSMEEREYLEGHCDRYKADIKEEEPSLTSPDGSRKRNSLEGYPHPPYSQDSAQEESYSPEHCEDDVIVIKVEDVSDDPVYRGDTPCKKEKIPAVMVEDVYSTRNVPNKCPVMCLNDDSTTNSALEDSITTNLHSRLLSYNQRSSPAQPHHTVNGDCELPPFSQYINRNIKCMVKGNPTRKTQTGSKKFECMQCGKCFMQTSHLVTHQRIHTGEKPHSCSICGKHFNDKSYLFTHLKIHTGEKPFKCSDCGKAFAKRSNLVRHQRIHSGEKPYSCSECGKRFAWKPSLLYHQIKHGGDQNHFQ